MSICRTPKLKDTCDTCSASKVKCKKQKPICSRCAKFNYQCCYSPAKRKGRPQPAKIGQKSLEVIHEQAEQRQDVAEADSVTSPAVSPRLSEQDYETSAKAISGPKEQRQQKPHKGVHRQYTTPQFLQGNPAWNNSLTLSPVESMAASAYTDEPGSGDLPHPQVEDLSCTLETAFNSTADVSPSVPSLAEHSNTDECADCGALALDMLQHLSSTTMQSPASFPSPTTQSSTSPSSLSPLYGELDGNVLDARINSASAAIKRLSQNLVCPCAGKIDIGMLNAALCTAILDTYATTLQYFPGSSEQTGANTGGSLGNGNGNDIVPSITARPFNAGVSNSVDADVQRSKANDQVVVQRIFEELPQVANLVMQFTTQYSKVKADAEPIHGNEDVTRLLSILATNQKSRLKDIINKITDQIMQFK